MKERKASKNSFNELLSSGGVFHLDSHLLWLPLWISAVFLEYQIQCYWTPLWWMSEYLLVMK